MLKSVIGNKVNEEAINSLMDALDTIRDENAVFYSGYPIAPTVDESIKVPALLVSQAHGFVCFDVVPVARLADLTQLKLKQKSIAMAVRSKLLQHPALADDDGDLAFKINVITFALNSTNEDDLVVNKIVSEADVIKLLNDFSAIDGSLFRHINSAIDRISNHRPSQQRATVLRADSKGGVLKKIEGEIANLDAWQKSAAIETPDGPQRIRGLAGSGKSVVLALKAAYLHGDNPNWNIGVTFHTRTLKQQFENLIKRFYFDDYRRDPDFLKLQIMHSFGSLGDCGVYSEICKAHGISPRDFGYAKRTYGFNNAFQGICQELLREVEKSPKIVFDALLIDEAQDLPREFLKLAYLCTSNHRIVWAYDDLQNLGDYQMKSLRDTFGADQSGNALVRLENLSRQPRQDIILPTCYRNTPWALATAHSLGSGIYRDPKLVQHPDDTELWMEIGYDLLDGELVLGNRVTLKRSDTASPQFFNRLIAADDAVKFISFDDVRSQFASVADMIEHDIKNNEVYAHDIAVIFPDAINAEKRGMLFRQFLADREIDSHMVGVTSTRNGFIMEGKIAISGPHRAKGNEAPIIYVMDADYCASGSELIKRRNILFTAITRSKGWVRVCGCGDGMAVLVQEFNRLKANDFKLIFTIPTAEELKKMRTVYRDISSDDMKRVAELRKVFEKLPDDEAEASAFLQALPRDLREKMQRSLNQIDQEF